MVGTQEPTNEIGGLLSVGPWRDELRLAVLSVPDGTMEESHTTGRGAIDDAQRNVN